MTQVPESRPITRQRERLSFETERVQVFQDDVILPGGATGSYLRIRSRGPGPGVVIVPVHGDHLGLVLTYRYATTAWEWGFPRGNAHSAHPHESAAIELREEMGIVTNDFELLGAITPDSGLLENRCTVLLARVEHRGRGALDTQEVHGTRWLPRAHLLREIATGRIEDGFTLSATALLMAREDGEVTPR